jgi:hypothetical protein
MAQQGDDWEVRIDPLSGRAIALRLAIIVAAALLVVAWRSAIWIGGYVVLFALLETSMLQIVVSPRRLTIRSWGDRLHGNPGVVRAIGPGWRLILRVNGLVRLDGPDPTLVPTPHGGPLDWWYRRRLVAACRRAGLEIVDESRAWLATHPTRRRISVWSTRAGLILWAAGAMLFAIPAAAADRGLVMHAQFVLLAGGLALGLIGYLAGPPDYRKPWNAAR